MSMAEIHIPFQLLALPNQLPTDEDDTERKEQDLRFDPRSEESFHIIINAKIKDSPVNLILDSGASKTVLDQDKYKDILEAYRTEKPIFSSGISENIEVQFVWLEGLSINGFEIDRFVSGLTQLTHINEIYGMYGLPYIDGLIGNDILIKYQAVINYKSNVLIIDPNV